MHIPAFIKRLQVRQNNDLGNAFNNFIDTLTGNTDSSSSSSNSNSNSNNNRNSAPTTVISVIFVTASPTFTGPTASLLTASNTFKVGTTSTTAQRQVTTTSATTAKQSSAVVATSSSTPSTKASTTAPTTTQTSASSAARTTAPTTTLNQGSIASQTASPSASAAPSAGLSGGAKAGIAFAVILGIALIAGIIVFVLKRKKQQRDKDEFGHNLDNEKAFFAHGGPTTAVAASRAPRLSLRPVTQFLPGVGEPKITEMTGSNAFGQPFGARNSPRSPHNDAANPFGSHAEKVDHADNAPIPLPNMSPRTYGPTAVTPVNANAPPAADPFADKHTASRPTSPESHPPSLRPGSPTKSDVSGATMVAGAAGAAALAGAAGAAAAGRSNSPPNQPNNVHRVQLDFKPSMDDELELRAGQVVRILHEYDDGWALCMRMDRSRQGVAPRTCLSKMPIKPRPAGPPPGMRPMGAPSSPGMRSFTSSPGFGPGPQQGGMYPAPLSPSTSTVSMDGSRRGPGSPPNGRHRSQSQSNSLGGGSPQMRAGAFGPAPKGQPRDHRRSASMGQLANANANANANSLNSLPSRKPVPGQAI